MSDTLPLPGLEPAASASKLTERQAFALAIIREHGPIRSVDLGAHLHEYRRSNGGRGHASDAYCDWCQDEGNEVAGALRRKGLVKRRRGEGWIALDAAPWRKPSLQIGAEDEWPEDLF